MESREVSTPLGTRVQVRNQGFLPATAISTLLSHKSCSLLLAAHIFTTRGCLGANFKERTGEGTG